MDFETMPLTPEEEDLVEERINGFADSMAPAEPHTGDEQIVFRVTDDGGCVIAGCIVHICSWGRAVLAKLWVDEAYRRQGLGSALIREAERAAREKECYYLCLGTVDYMARPLYEKHGFTVFTVNRDIPRGHTGWSMSKRLDRPGPEYMPANNAAAERYRAEPGSAEDARIITDGLNRYCLRFIPDGHEPIGLSRKLVDRDGRMIAAVISEVDGEDIADIDGIWVDERYRGQGLGTRLMREIEREAKKNGAYVIVSNCCDWVSGFFFGNGYAVRGELPDYPRGHMAYEIEKRL